MIQFDIGPVFGDWVRLSMNEQVAYTPVVPTVAERIDEIPIPLAPTFVVDGDKIYIGTFAIEEGLVVRVAVDPPAQANAAVRAVAA